MRPPRVEYDRLMSTAPYGSWRSPVSTELLTEGSLGLDAPSIDGEDVYWLESRAHEQGRTVLVRRNAEGIVSDVTPAPFNVRSRVHEYGGASYVVRNGLVVFANFADQRLYLLTDSDPTPRPITPAGDLRFADLVIDDVRGIMYAVREDHRGAGEAVNTLVRLELHSANDDGGTVIFAGTDFVSSASVSPDGSRLAWLTWNHPNMPWDGTTLRIGTLDARGDIGAESVVAGGFNESIFQPRWSPTGRLFFLSDRSGWWNFYASDRASGDSVAILPLPLEFGAPQWRLGTSTYDFTDDDRLLCTFFDDGNARLGVLDLSVGTLSEIDTEGCGFSGIQVSGDVAVLVVGYPRRPSAVACMTVHNRRTKELRRSTDTAPDDGVLSVAEAVEWKNSDGHSVFGFYYRPLNSSYDAPQGELPPLLVLSHGGPTSMSGASLSLGLQYWTSRGFAVLDVNYGGSTGYGRDYRRRLENRWGIVDVDDCATGAIAMADQGRVDRARLAIRGGSAGGYTTLCALVFTDVFAAGASHYGVGDLEALARDTHKFESRYLDGLVGPYPLARDVYVDRSPIHHVDALSCPLILLQGLDDKVVPPNQAVTMADAVRAKGLPVALVMVPGEGHGFRQSANIKRALEAELFFYSKVLGFEPADSLEPVEIDNLS